MGLDPRLSKSNSAIEKGPHCNTSQWALLYIPSQLPNPD
jgi:hypothetical protein